MIVNNDTLKELQDRLVIVNGTLSRLESMPEVQTYISLKKDKKDLIDGIENVVKGIQHTCSHDFWYYLGEDTDSHEGRSYYTCKCLDCDHVLNDRTREFSKVIKTDEKFSIVQNKYAELKNITQNDDTMFNLLKEHFAKK